ncbi:glucuronyl esterase domain-containing protein [Sorangium sp. So ce1000]|uniref:glucuronyl esterase domain-containing protein n=1 Tax=Sorangium sp. So ce1000 TaxID=3133325 RepID=UPI003F62D572
MTSSSAGVTTSVGQGTGGGSFPAVTSSVGTGGDGGSAVGGGDVGGNGGGDGGAGGGAGGGGDGGAGGGGTAGAGGGGDGGAGGGGGGDTGPVTSDPVEDSGAKCPKPTLPAASALPVFETHHDPFLMLSGSRITKKSEWACRRAEIKAQVEEYESGTKPAVSKDNVTGQFSGNKLTVNVSEGGKSVSFSINISRPSGASGAIPLLIGVGGSNLDNTVFSQNGVATATFDNNAMGAQSGGGSRGTGTFYNLYGSNHSASSMIAWAWGISRIIDALEKTPGANIDPKRIAVTGCSRNGKGALTAGAFDERIVLTIPQESGAGGSASWRVSQAGSSAGENVQTLSSAAGEQPWFRANFGSNFGNRVTSLPFDHHMVMGMVAPRAMLVIDNKIDWLGIDSTFTAGSIAHEIWKGLGVPDKMGYWQLGGHNHCAFPSAQRAMLEAYVKKFLVGGGTDDTNVLKSDGAKADLAKWMKWTAPTLQ